MSDDECEDLILNLLGLHPDEKARNAAAEWLLMVSSVYSAAAELELLDESKQIKPLSVAKH